MLEAVLCAQNLVSLTLFAPNILGFPQSRALLLLGTLVLLLVTCPIGGTLSLCATACNLISKFRAVDVPSTERGTLPPGP